MMHNNDDDNVKHYNTKGNNDPTYIHNATYTKIIIYVGLLCVLILHLLIVCRNIKYIYTNT